MPRFSSFYKPFEDGQRKLVLLPSYFGMPLHAEREAVGTRIDDRLDNPIRRARDHAQIASDLIDGLMMRAVDARGFAAGKFGEQRTGLDPDVMRGSINGLPLLVFDGLGQLGRQVLDQRSAARDVEGLHTEANAQHRRRATLGHFEQYQIGL